MLAEEARKGLADLDATAPQLQALDARLAVIAKGEPATDADRLPLAQCAYDTRQHMLAARLWGEALAADPKLADDRQAQHHYNAARSAALAASGGGKDEPPPDEATEPAFADRLSIGSRASCPCGGGSKMTEEPGSKETVAQNLRHWKTDADLAGIRDELLALLPEGERSAFKQLWSDVDHLMTKAAAGE